MKRDVRRKAGRNHRKVSIEHGASESHRERTRASVGDRRHPLMCAFVIASSIISTKSVPNRIDGRGKQMHANECITRNRERNPTAGKRKDRQREKVNSISSSK